MNSNRADGVCFRDKNGVLWPGTFVDCTGQYSVDKCLTAAQTNEGVEDMFGGTVIEVALVPIEDLQ